MYLRRSYPASKPNNSFKPNLLRYSKSVAEIACHAFASTTQVGLTLALNDNFPQSSTETLGRKHSFSNVVSRHSIDLPHGLNWPIQPNDHPALPTKTKGAYPTVRALCLAAALAKYPPYFTSSTLSSHFSCFSSPSRLATVAAMLDRPAVGVCLRPSLPPLTLSKSTSGTGLRVWAVLAL